MADASNRGRQAFRMKGTMPALTTLCLLTDDLDAIERQLAEQISQMPQFFFHAPVLVDVEALGDSAVEFSRLSELLRRRQLVPVAIKNPSQVQKDRAIEAGWGVLQNPVPTGRTPSPPRVSGAEDLQSPWPPPVGPAPAQPPSRPQGAEPSAGPALERSSGSLTVRAPVRSGQVVNALGTDLVVLAAVSSGAELISTGHIHVYAPLRGRALAGAHGNPTANIFCTALEAEFLCIDGYYLMAEEIPKDLRGKAARVYLEGEQLVVARL